MVVDGKEIAGSILTKLTETVKTLKKGGITPTLAVILVGDDMGSLSYIKQKQKAGERIGARVIFDHLPEKTTKETLASAIAHYNNDPEVHGLIVQRPVPIPGVEDTLASVVPSKDVDGFVPNSPFEVPVARGVIEILQNIHQKLRDAQLDKKDFKSWLNGQAIAVIGRGETAGKPIALTLAKYDCATSIIHSQTPNPKTILKNSTVIIGCAGKKHIITKSAVTRGVILIAVGIWRDKEGKLHGDYEPEDIEGVASFYTPTPGGVGPVNVACLMHNLIDACIMSVVVE